jgi:hypothetical protein
LASAYTVQDLTNELKVYQSTARSGRAVHEWPRFVRSLWGKTFVRSAGSHAHPTAPPMPGDLVAQVTGLDPFQAVVIIVGRARATVSGGSADREIAIVEQNARRFLETPEGKQRQRYLDDHPTP